MINVNVIGDLPNSRTQLGDVFHRFFPLRSLRSLRFILFAIEGCSTRNTSKQLRRTSGSQRLGSAAAICRLRAPMQHGRGVPAAIQQSLQQWIAIVFSPSGDGDDQWHRRRERNEHRLRVRQLAHFSGRKRHTFSCRSQREQRRQVLDVMANARRESGSLARGADGGVAGVPCRRRYN